MFKLNGLKLKLQKFPAGETRIELSPKQLQDIKINATNIITWNYAGDEEFITLSFLVDKIREINAVSSICLEVPYLPHARMDRTKTQSQFCTLKYVGHFLNSLDLDSVIVNDVHSDIAFDYIDNLTNISSTGHLVQNLIDARKFNKDDIIICFPDESAEKRFGYLLEDYPEFITLEKERDFETGKINSTRIAKSTASDLENKKILIVDDICSYGGTFLNAIKTIKDEYAQNQDPQMMDSAKLPTFFLVVTHLEKAFYHGDLYKQGLLDSWIHKETLDYSLDDL